MKELERQRGFVKLCSKLHQLFTEIFDMMHEAYGEKCLSLTLTSYEWYRRFKSGWISTEDDAISGRPSTSTDVDHAGSHQCKQWSHRTWSCCWAEHQYRFVLHEFDRKNADVTCCR